MAVTVQMRADSRNQWGVRISTLEIEMPRFLLAQFNTHRMFSRNAQSSRAIPVAKLIQKTREDPYVPVFAQNQKGMVAGGSLATDQQETARMLWVSALSNAAYYAEQLAELGVAKQWANRLLEPFSYVKVLVTATEWDNFFKLRLDHAAQPEMQDVARGIKSVMDASIPKELSQDEWHLPFGEKMPEGLDLLQRLKVATARAARISYDSHDGTFDPENDYRLHDQLLRDGHLSPFEHCAMPGSMDYPYYNLRGWVSYRWMIENNVL